MPMETLGLPSTIHCRNRTPMVAVEAAKVLLMNTREATSDARPASPAGRMALLKKYQPKYSMKVPSEPEAGRTQALD